MKSVKKTRKKTTLVIVELELKIECNFMFASKTSTPRP